MGNLIIASVLLFVLYTLYTKPKTVENYVSFATSVLPKFGSGSESETLLLMPTKDFPMILYSDTLETGTSSAMKIGETKTIFYFDNDGIIRSIFKSLKLLEGHTLEFCSHDLTTKAEKRITANPRFNTIDDFDRYLKEDPMLKMDSVFNYNPGQTKNTVVTVRVI